MLQRIFSVIPVKTGIQDVYGLRTPNWIPAFAGMTHFLLVQCRSFSKSRCSTNHSN